ncbi:MAG: alkaline phosphatase family protein [Bacteroidales bacterium]|jgi:predicted AlkP superfamily pyrophosphatase or phosphodiesterase|nr:alkaline phosphatase family protein [Bacteroidales bacterium]
MKKKINLTKSILIFTFILFKFGILQAQDQFNKPPKLVVGIVIEEMRYEMLLRYWDSFGDNGFKRIINQGAFCTQTHHNYLITQNGVGQASIVTGTYPYHHGIIADSWSNRLTGEIVDCANESMTKTMIGEISKRDYSPKNIMSSTLGDELKLATNDSSKVISVSLNPVSAVISGGRIADYAFWFNNSDGGWITGNYYSDHLPIWVEEFNGKGFQTIYMKKNWASMYSLDNNYKYSLPDDTDFEIGFRNYRYTFPYDLAYLKNRSGNFKYLKYTPFGNTYTKDFAVSAIVNEELGKDDFTDFLAISFSATNFSGELFGPRSVEMEDLFLRLDQDLEHLINFLDDEIGLENILIYLTSDRGVSDVPEYLISKKQNAGVFDGNKAINLLNSYLSILYQEGIWVKYYYSRQLYLNQQLIDETGVDLREIQNKVADFMVQFTGVANALPATTINSTNFESGINQKIQNSFHQKRSGDVLINLEPGWIEKNGYVTKSGSGYKYDTHVPLIWYGWKVKATRIDEPIDIVDIAPTISWILKITSPNASVGNPIFQIVE